MNTGKTLLAVLAGVATGAVLGVMFAPDKGSASRKKLYKKGEALADALEERIDDRFDALLSRLGNKVKTKVDSESLAMRQTEVN